MRDQAVITRSRIHHHYRTPEPLSLYRIASVTSALKYQYHLLLHEAMNRVRPSWFPYLTSRCGPQFKRLTFPISERPPDPLRWSNPEVTKPNRCKQYLKCIPNQPNQHQPGWTNLPHQIWSRHKTIEQPDPKHGLAEIPRESHPSER